MVARKLEKFYQHKMHIENHFYFSKHAHNMFFYHNPFQKMFIKVPIKCCFFFKTGIRLPFRGVLSFFFRSGIPKTNPFEVTDLEGLKITRRQTAADVFFPFGFQNHHSFILKFQYIQLLKSTAVF